MKRVTCWAALSAIALITACSENHDHAGHAEPTIGAPAVVDSAADPSQVQDGVAVQNAWVRPTVGEQDATGGYLTITSQEPLALVGVASPAAEISEVHEMKMEGDIMRMRRAERIELKAGEPLELKPGGYHLMLMSLTAPIQAGQEIELSLQFEKPDGSKIEMPVKAKAGQNAAGSGHHDQSGHGEHKH